MYVKDIEVVQGIMRSLDIQMSKLNSLNNATNIHIQINGVENVRMNFLETPGTFMNYDTNNSDYDYAEAFDFLVHVLNARIKYLRDRLATYGVVIEGE